MLLGHHVSVLAPGDEDMPGLPPYVVMAGKAVPIPYNGSVARVQFGVVSAARVRRWLRDGEFDVVHVHEPAPPSLSLLTCMIHDGPMVGDVPRGDRAVAVPGDVRHRAAAVPREAVRTDRGLAGRAQGDRRAPRRRRGRHPERRGGVALRRRAPAAGLPPRGRDDRLHRPLRRAAQGHGRAGRRRRAAGRRSPAAAGARGRARRGRGVPRPAAGRRSATGSRCSARSARPTRRGCCAAWTCTARPTPARRASA